ncbi:MAG: MarC family protein [Candidatus Micrarchaeota archaeon]
MLREFAFALASLVVVYNPFSKPPIFLSLTNGMSEKEREVIANRSVVIAGLIGILVALFGSALLEILNVRMSSFKIAGGLMLLIFGVQFGFGLSLNGDSRRKYDVAAVPLASPLLTGPGAMSTIMLLSLQYGALITLAALAVCLVVCLLFLRFSKLINDFLGEQVIEVLSRIMGVVLVAFAVQFVTSGLSNL